MHSTRCHTTRGRLPWLGKLWLLEYLLFFATLHSTEAEEIIAALHHRADIEENLRYEGNGGLDFDVLSPIEVIEFGIIDIGLDGIGRAATVELWTRNVGDTPGDSLEDVSDDTGGELLARLEIQGSEGELIGADRFLPLPEPILIPEGHYTIVAWAGEAFPVHDLGGADAEMAALAGLTITETDLIKFVGSGRYGTREDVGTFPPTFDNLEMVPNSFAAVNFRFARPTDTDNDGLRDWWESKHELDPHNATDAAEDTDGDGLTNLEEFETGTLPREADTDQDGLLDGVETNTGVWVSALDTGTDPLSANSDGDLFVDGLENPDLPFDPASALEQPGTDPNKSDTDGDGESDGFEASVGSDPTSGDSVPPETTPIMVEDFDLQNLKSTFVFSDAFAKVVPSEDANHQNVARLTDVEPLGGNHSIAWDYVATAARIVRISFQFRMTDDAANTAVGGCCGEAGNGFGVGLFSTESYRIIGPSHLEETREWEDPRAAGGFPDAFFVGFDIFNHGVGSGGNNIRIAGPSQPTTPLADVTVPFEMNDDRFHQAEISIVNEGMDSIAVIDLIEDINGVALKHHIAEARVPDLDLMNQFAGRLIIGGRTDRTFVTTDIDHVSLSTFGPARLAITGMNRAGNDVTLTWQSTPGNYYAVDTSEDLFQWQPVVTEYPEGGAMDTLAFFTDMAVPVDNSKRYYRVRKVLPPIILTTDFEEGPGGWTATTDRGETVWELGTPNVEGLTMASSGNQAWGTDVDGDYAPNTSTSLRSPVIDVSGEHSPRLSFNYYMDSIGLASGQVRFLDEEGRILASVNDLFSGQSFGWQPFHVLFPPEARGAKVMIEFVFLSDDDSEVGAGWYIDDVRVD